MIVRPNLLADRAPGAVGKADMDRVVGMQGIVIASASIALWLLGLRVFLTQALDVCHRSDR
jgi:hypothetical protein